MSRILAVVCPVAVAVALTGPATASAKPVGSFEWIVTGPGDQTEPSIDGPFVVYADRVGGDSDVRMLDLVGGSTSPIAAGPGDQAHPDVSHSTVAFLAPGGVGIYNHSLELLVRAPQEAGPVDPPAASTAVVAWAAGTGARDVVYVRLADPALATHVLERAGDQHGPAAHDGWLAWIDDAGSPGVRLLELAGGAERTLVGGRVTTLALGGAGPAGDVTRAALARVGAAGDPDVEVRALDGALLAALVVPGEQRNPHLSGDWVAFEDLSTGRSQVVLWNYTTGVAYLPRPSESDQILNDLSVVHGVEIRVVFADDEPGDFDVALYRLPWAWSDDGTPPEWPPPPPPPPPPPGRARCDDLAATPLAALALTRDSGEPRAREAAFEAPAAMAVLVCVDAERVSSAWVTLDGEAMVRPSDVQPQVVHLEVRGAVDAGPGKLSAVIAGTPGATLQVRVLADPGGPLPPAARAAPSPRRGCGSEGAGILALLGLLGGAGRCRRRAGGA